MDYGVRQIAFRLVLEELQSSIQLYEHLLREESQSLASEEPESSSRQPPRGGESGAQYVFRLLTETDNGCHVQLRLDRDMFIYLVHLMRSRQLLEDGRFVKIPEQVAMCLYVLAKGQSYRDAGGRFRCSPTTIGLYFKKVLDALVMLSHDIIRPHRDFMEAPSEVTNDERYWPYFKDAIGALDGTLIEAVVSDENGVPFRTRKGHKSWNVLAVCSFDQIFTYIHVGWEGSAHDTTVWKHALTNPEFGFPHPPPGKYYLVDSGYPNTLGYMAPFSDGIIRRHLPEFRNAAPRGLAEHFNKQHSSLRMKIEGAFGQLKSSWKILKRMPQTSTDTQQAIIVSCFTLHNFIRMQELEIPIVDHMPTEGASDSHMFDRNRKRAMAEVRDAIALQIWESFGNDVSETESLDESE